MTVLGPADLAALRAMQRRHERIAARLLRIHARTVPVLVALAAVLIGRACLPTLIESFLP